MTSLALFDSTRPPADDFVKPGVDWGTSKTRSRSNDEPSSSHPSGTFIYQGEPTKQNYRNTDITLSNVRINDELIPAAFHTLDMTPHQIQMKFPSNHPFSSHISEKAIFPNASTNLDDRPSTNTDPYIVTHKIRGNPFRREVHYGGFRRQQHRNSRWPDQQYMQLPRSVSDLGLSSIYPWPRQVFSPNNEHFVDNSATTTVKNKERTRMESTYQGDYTNTEGLGSHVIFDTTVTLAPTDRLQPYFNKTMDPARPIEGIQAGHIHGNHRQPSALERPKKFAHKPPKNPIRLMSEEDRLDDHMRHGTDYVNLPAHLFPTDRAPRWTQKSEANLPDNSSSTTPEIRYLHPPINVPQILRDHQVSHQQIEAENRLQQIEVIRPEDNINLLNIKFRTLQHARHPRPVQSQYHQDYVNTFYDQLGTFVQERSGLYHTNNYDPTFLSQSMTELGNYNPNNEPAFKDERNLSDLLDNAEHTQDRSKPKLFQYKALGDYQQMRSRLINPLNVPLDSSTVDVRTQEGNEPMIQRESVYGDSYNTRKFLQENILSSHARTDPTALMSTNYNGNLERVRNLNSYPLQPSATPSLVQQEQTNDIVVGPLLPPSPYDELYSSKYINEHTDGYSRRSMNRVYDSPFKAEHDATIYKTFAKEPTIVAPYLMKAEPLSRVAKTVLRLPGPEVVLRAIEPTSEPHSTYQHSYQDVSFHEIITPMSDFKPHLAHNRLAMKDNDPRFGRTPDGRVKQWKLIDLQDHWTKTNAQRQYHAEHPESVPYVGDATVRTNKEIVIADIIEKQQIITVR